MVALMIYATYTLTNRLRQEQRRLHDHLDSHDALVQAVREGAKGHAKAMKSLRDTWTSTGTREAIPPRPLTPFASAELQMKQLANSFGQQSAKNVNQQLEALYLQWFSLPCWDKEAHAVLQERFINASKQQNYQA